MLLKLLVGFVIAILVVFIVWMIKGLLLTPVKCGEDTKLYIFIHPKGEAPSLEHVLKGLLWLRENGTLAAEIQIITDDCEEGAYHIAEHFSDEYSFIRLKLPESYSE